MPDPSASSASSSSPASSPSSASASRAALTRRHFLQSAGVAAAAVALAPHVRGQDQADKKIGYAIVGLGRFGAGQLLRSLPECKLARPAALVSGDPAKAKELAGKYGVKDSSIYNYD